MEVAEVALRRKDSDVADPEVLMENTCMNVCIVLTGCRNQDSAQCHMAVQHSQLHWGPIHHVPSGWGTDKGHSFAGRTQLQNGPTRCRGN